MPIVCCCRQSCSLLRKVRAASRCLAVLHFPLFLVRAARVSFRTLTMPVPWPGVYAGARCSVHCATSPDLTKPEQQGHYYFDSNCAPATPSRCERVQAYVLRQGLALVVHQQVERATQESTRPTAGGVAVAVERSGSEAATSERFAAC